ncbi:tRNA 5-hydroxyuridine modification protein YegQ [Aestuariirhabdus sp. Z084]|uniref:prephenate-dependent tRNA uridine(34) hydroxylase TrhP n=1 Tax=Aestuariirhabdus haliotis TaxID=2918751 RepID=UPI00201B3969|nr:tRNA 5-hydroxyuridine modification protein YegQ [Aestuariirhabdus haliotis]MCL6414293.1 tRNA 5-hydroxyuridine modification protein YegQ [Aestuariirhabdus haliotis]MCL6418225.1 tRNA 5-hydroxyuridine modification protein YegQ [Aestuariirhabdus haliotis]
MKPELLSPAGTLKNMHYAFAYGADAVYAGQPRYSLRVRNNDFKLENLEQGIQFAHQQGKQFYLASNIAPHNSKVKTYLKDIEPVIAMKPDALIMSDPGLIMLVREQWPDMPIHLSVQANVVNYAAVKFWYQMGVSRIILSRELSLDEIEEIRMQCPEMELEVFVHGSLCIAYSGRCLLSGYINHRDPNQGTCTNACRWKYDSHEATETPSGDIVPVQQMDPAAETVEPQLGEGAPSDKIVLLQEQGRPDDYMPAFEDEHGTYIMNSKDLRAIQHVERLTKMGIHSLKIEGRTKSHYYVSRTAQVYRQAIDDAAAGKSFDRGLMDILENLASRGYTEGFYRRHVHDEYQNYERGNSVSTTQQFVGEVVECDQGMVTIDVKNRFQLGDQLELMTPQGNHRFTLTSMENHKGASVEVAPGNGHRVRFPVGDLDVDPHGLLVRDLPTAAAGN